MFNEPYYIYILTNYNKTVLYIGVTNNLSQRLIEHYLNVVLLTHLPGNIIVFIYCIMNRINMYSMQLIEKKK